MLTYHKLLYFILAKKSVLVPVVWSSGFGEVVGFRSPWTCSDPFLILASSAASEGMVGALGAYKALARLMHAVEAHPAVTCAPKIIRPKAAKGGIADSIPKGRPRLVLRCCAPSADLPLACRRCRAVVATLRLREAAPTAAPTPSAKPFFVPVPSLRVVRRVPVRATIPQHQRSPSMASHNAGP